MSGSDISRVATNLSALNTYNILTKTNNKLVSVQTQIATGQQINKASDDPAGYYATQKLTLDVTTLKRRARTIERGINYLQTNHSKLENVTDIMTEMIDLSEQANSVAVTTAERAVIQSDLEQLREEVDEILQSGIDPHLYSGFSMEGLDNVSLSGTGTNAAPTLTDLTLNGSNIDVETDANIQTTIDNITNAHSTIAADQAKLGSFVKRMQHKLDVIDAELINTQSSLSTVRDADLAAKQIEMLQLQIKQESSLAMFSQAHLNPFKVLDLLNGSSE